MRNYFKILGVEDLRNLMTRDELRDRLRSHSKDKHYVYVIWRADKPNSEPMYIGKGKGRRVLCHFIKSDQANRLKKAIFEKMTRKGCEPIFSLIGTEMNDEEASQLEIAAISKVGRIDQNNGPLTNLREGGDGSASSRTSGSRHGKARAVVANGTKYELLKDAALALGVYPSAIHKRINAGWPGYYYEDVGQQERLRPKKHSAEHIASMRSKTQNRRKPVCVSGINYPSLSAAAAALGLHYSTVRQKCSSGILSFSYLDQ